MPYPGSEAIDPCLAETEICEGSEASFFGVRTEATLRSTSSAWLQYYSAENGCTYLNWPGLFEFLISRDGRRIEGRPSGTGSWEAFQTYLLGQVLSFALIKQGIEPLHGTVMVVSGMAVGIIGDCGYGKSTLAAAFLKAGHQLLSDDLLVLKEVASGLLVYPSFPRIKLFPEIAQSILGEQVSGTPMNPHTRKLIIPLSHEQFCRELKPLRVIFVLRPRKPGAQGKRVAIRNMSQRQASLALTANTFNAVITEPERLKRLFRLTAKLAASVPIKSLSYPRDLDRLPEVVEAVRLNLAK